MQDNNGKYIFFSSLGKRTTKFFLIKNYFIPKKDHYFSIKNKLNNSLIEYDEDKEEFLEKDIFDISYQNKKEQSNINDFYSLNNKYKSNKIHLEKLKKFREEKLLEKERKHYEQIYEPNIDYIKKRIIIGPKWENITGRKDNKTTNNSLNIEKHLKDENTNLINKNNEFLDEEKTNYDLNKTTLKDKKRKNINLFKRKLLHSSKNIFNKKDIQKAFKFSFYNNTKRKFFSPKKEKKLTPKNKSMINLNTKLLISKLYILDKIKVDDTKIAKYISPSTKTFEGKKSFNIKNGIKIFKSKNIGLNLEELKFINEIKNYKKIKLFNNKELNKKIKSDKKSNIIKKIKYVRNKDNKIINNDNYDLKENLWNKKSHNYYIIKSFLKPKVNKKFEYLNKKDSNSFSNKINKFNKFYDFDCDKIDIYNFNKFDNITYKTISNKK